MMKTFPEPVSIQTRIIRMLPIISAVATLTVVVSLSAFRIYESHASLKQVAAQQNSAIQTLSGQMNTLTEKLHELETDDQYVANKTLKKNIAETKTVYIQAMKTYEKLVDAKLVSKDQKLDKTFAEILYALADLQYASAASKLTALNKQIDEVVASAQVLRGIDLASLTSATEPPTSGYRRQKVNVGGNEYVVDIATGDLSNTKVIVDTASNETCGNECPVLSLADYAVRNGAWAAINGSYFCPASYPSCTGKTNSFDLLVMNKNKVYFNSDNNVYSTNPAVIFMGNAIRFVGKAQEWGRDTGIDSMISNYPLLLMNGAVQFGGNDDVKMSSNSNRAFVAAKGNTAYIGVIHGVSVVGAAKVLQTMGMEHAINMDSGGSTAMWVTGSYKAGPGRNIPNAILFLKK